jgi:hypothetical protein
MPSEDTSTLFKGVYFGMKNKNGNHLYEGDSVRLYNKGEYVVQNYLRARVGHVLFIVA